MTLKQKPDTKLMLVACAQGNPEYVVPRCTDYWDGEAIWHFPAERQKFVLDKYRQWRAEDL